MAESTLSRSIYETLSLALASGESSGEAKALSVCKLLPDNGPVGLKVNGLMPFILAFG